jgi:putative flippase GtrA
VRQRIDELVRYVINGLAATGVHYGMLTFNLKVLGITSAGLANLLAAVFGITASFLGSRYFVFRDVSGPVLTQATKFGGLYAVIALFHGVVLLCWTDWLGFDYRIGFVLATLLQMSLSYVGNKRLVFNT